ncbi:TOPRIM nucleotidyl transferase/hydrolase domain-containing protein [Pseudactinotalea sp.]|uniref:TOPRIM nucleotidyl transferase/hydrolase domain-containing protein n=1 Tax=Pseudactinotalea sp. TaxID=1926260 RepID=UPI003B3A8854
MSQDPTAPKPVPGAVAAILVEGRSDEAAVRAAARLLDLDLEAAGVLVAPIGGAMAFRRALAEYGPGGAHGDGLRLAGLVDVGEVRHTCRALFDGLDDEPYDGALAHAGFFVCKRDLEDELIRALGAGRVQAVLDDRGDLDRFRTFQHQPAHRDEPVTDQLRRFLGTTAGRKIAYGAHLVEALAPGEIPTPLRSAVEHAIQR